MKRYILCGIGIGILAGSLAGCAIHRQAPLSAAQHLLATTPPTINHSPTPTH